MIACFDWRKPGAWARSVCLISAAVGCGDTWAPVSCDAIGNVLEGATFSEDFDYVGLYRDNAGLLVPTTPGVAELGSSGIACQTASNMPQCMEAYATASAIRESCKTDKECGVFAVTTRGDEVTRIEDRTAFVRLLGAIDTQSDALALSAWDNKPTMCGTVFTYDRGTYTFSTEYDNCGMHEQRDTWEVSPKGATSRTESEVLGETHCVF